VCVSVSIKVLGLNQPGSPLSPIALRHPVPRSAMPERTLEEPVEAFALHDRRLARITQCTHPISLTVAGNHVETRQLYLIQSLSVPVILGHPWLVQHEPHVAWSFGTILEWSSSCHVQCLQAATSPSPRPTPCLSLRSTMVFSKTQAQSLPPHRPYSCTIDLHPGASFPSRRLYSLSIPEKAAMDVYISESLAAGLIRPLSSLVAAGFFFVKKDGGLRPCIDCRQEGVYCGGRRLGHRVGVGPFPTGSGGSEGTTLCVLFSTLSSRGGELRHRESGVAGSGSCSGGVAPLAGGGGAAINHLDRP